MFGLGTLKIRDFIRNGKRLGRAPILALALCLIGGGVADAWAGNDTTVQDLTARPQLKLVPRGVGGNASATLPPYGIIEHRPVDILDRLNLSGPAKNADQALSEFVDEARVGAGVVWNWLNSDGEGQNLREVPRVIGGPLPRLSTLRLPISALPAQLQLLDVEDPYEPINRLVFDMNFGLERHVYSPFAGFYHKYTAPEVRNSVRQFFSNLREPVTIASSALAGNLTNAGNATARFGINTTLGIAGLFDPATGMGFAHRPYDFEEMLCQYGVPSGPYVVLPLLGSATVRDATARLLTVAAYFEVMGASIYIPYRASDISVNYVDIRQTMESLNADALDPYVVHRTLYVTQRNENCGTSVGVH